MGQETNILDRQDIHILVIDDDDRIRSLLRTYLGKCGFRVSTVGHANEARKLMETLAFDLLIVDVMMPDETGFEFTKRLREQDDIPVIMLTALSASEDRIEGLKTGADDYLPKPFEPEELVLRIDAIFRRVGLTAPASKVPFGPYIFDLERHILTKGNERVSLTTGEEVMLNMLAKRGGVAVSRHALSETGSRVPSFDRYPLLNAHSGAFKTDFAKKPFWPRYPHYHFADCYHADGRRLFLL